MYGAPPGFELAASYHRYMYVHVYIGINTSTRAHSTPSTHTQYASVGNETNDKRGIKETSGK